MPNITTQYSSWDNLKPGDAIHKVGHVRMFIQKNPNGSLKVVESAARNWDVSYWSFLLSDLTAYTPRYYNAMEDDYIHGRADLTSAIIIQPGQIKLTWNADTTNIIGYRLYKSPDGSNFALLMDESMLKNDHIVLPSDNSPAYFRISKVSNSPAHPESNWSNTLSAYSVNGTKKYLIVDGFAREIGSWQGAGHNFVVSYAKALSLLSASYDVVKSSHISLLGINLSDYFGVIWILGDESTVDESLSDTEQNLIKNYLEDGGRLFISGSEIGWDLFARGTASDKNFYNNYLKASFIADDAGSVFVKGLDSTSMQGLFFYFGQVYEEDFPDVIGDYGGSKICMQYSTNTGAGVQYAGRFGASANIGKVIYFAFPLETTANEISFNQVIRNADIFFNSPYTSVDESSREEFRNLLYQNYPNPFRTDTKIKYTLQSAHSEQLIKVSLKVYDILGREVAALVDAQQPKGEYEVTFEGKNFPSGLYYYKLTAGEFTSVKKMMLIR